MDRSDRSCVKKQASGEELQLGNDGHGTRRNSLRDGNICRGRVVLVRHVLTNDPLTLSSTSFWSNACRVV